MTFPSSVLVEQRRYIPQPEPATLPPVLPPLMRVLHDAELPPSIRIDRPNLPEVHPFFDSHFWKFNEAWQRFTFDLNPHLTPDKWTAVYSFKRFITNNNGFGDEGDPRTNYITDDIQNSDPKCEVLVCGGAVLAGRVAGTQFIPATLNSRDKPPSVAWLLERPWLYFHAVTVDGRGTPRMFPQGNGTPVLIPLVADRTRYPVITFPMSKLKRWTGPGLPDPYRVYG